MNEKGRTRDDDENPDLSNTSQLLAPDKNEVEGSRDDADTKCENCDNTAIG